MKQPITLPRIERFLKVTGWGPSRFGRAAAGDPSLVARLRNGRALTEEASTRIAAFITSYVDQEAARVRKLRDLSR